MASISILTGGTASEAKTIHKRPALLQDLEWRPSRWILGSVSPSTDAVRQIVFSFYDDRLFRIVVDYDHERTEGLTDADMIDAISAVYGTRLTRTSGRAARVASRVEIESGSSVAKWGDAGHVVALYRTASYGDALRLICDGFVWAGGQEKSPGKLVASLRRTESTIEWDAVVDMDRPIKTVTSIVLSSPVTHRVIGNPAGTPSS